MNKKLMVLGGGTFSHVRAHLALAAPAFGNTAKAIAAMCESKFEHMDTVLKLTKMADSASTIVTNDDVNDLVTEIINDNTVKVVFFNIALCDYEGKIGDVDSSKYAERMSTTTFPTTIMSLTVSQKIISRIRERRKDIFLVGFKTTCNATSDEQYSQALNLLKKSSCNLVLANDIGTRNNFIVTPEEGVYSQGMTRDECLRELVDIAYWRTHLSFTRSTVVEGLPVAWQDAQVPSTLRQVINWCVSEGAYKEFNGVTTGHFAAKLAPTEFLTSIRKTNFNAIDKNGMVRVKTDGDDRVISYGAKPSVGGQSQRIVFGTYQDTDCIVHFHCPLKSNPRDVIPVVSQREYECGSHECGQNTADGLREVVPGIYAVMLDKHGPNIVFNHAVDANKVIEFIDANFDLDKSTSGFEKVYLNI